MLAYYIVGDGFVMRLCCSDSFDSLLHPIFLLILVKIVLRQTIVLIDLYTEGN